MKRRWCFKLLRHKHKSLLKNRPRASPRRRVRTRLARRPVRPSPTRGSLAIRVGFEGRIAVGFQIRRRGGGHLGVALRPRLLQSAVALGSSGGKGGLSFLSRFGHPFLPSLPFLSSASLPQPRVALVLAVLGLLCCALSSIIKKETKYLYMIRCLCLRVRTVCCEFW